LSTTVFYGVAANSREQYYTAKMPASCRSGKRLQKCGGIGTIANDMLEAAEKFSTVNPTRPSIRSFAESSCLQIQQWTGRVRMNTPLRHNRSFIEALFDPSVTDAAYYRHGSQLGAAASTNSTSSRLHGRYS